MAKTPDLTPDPLVRVVVHQRRSVMYQVAGVHRTAAGGEMIEVPGPDAAYLRAHGFLHEPNAAPIETQTGQSRGSWSEDDPRPTINGDDGSVVRGG
jgi:hypothetical protein